MTCAAPEAAATPIAVITAGTSDLRVAEEAAVTAEFYGNPVQRIRDVGVSGIHRLLARLDDIRAARALIVVAGMEGALPSVVAGLVDKPVIAVPTSVGYGAAFGGATALLACCRAALGPVGGQHRQRFRRRVPCQHDQPALDPEGQHLAWNNFFGDMGFPDAERAYGAVLRHAKRACFWWIPGALKCFKGAENRTVRPLSLLESMLFLARQRRGGRAPWFAQVAVAS